MKCINEIGDMKCITGIRDMRYIKGGAQDSLIPVPPGLQSHDR